MKKSDNDIRIDFALKRFLAKHPSFSPNPLGEWSELVGPQVARYSQPKTLKNKVLLVHAYDSIWKHHLDLNKDLLLEKINATQSKPLVEKIIVRVGEIPESHPILNPNYKMLNKIKAKSIRPKKKKKTPLRQLTQDEKDLLASLPDPDLRAIGKKLLRRLPAGEQPE